MTTIKDDLFSYVKHVNILNQDFISTISKPSKEVQEMVYQLAFLDMYETGLNYPKVNLAKKDISQAEKLIDEELLNKYKQKITGLQTMFKNPDSALSITIKGLATNVADQDIAEFYRYLTAKLMNISIQSTNPRLTNVITTLNVIMSNNQLNQQQSNMTIVIIIILVILMLFLYVTYLKPYLKKNKEDSDSDSDE